MTSEPVSVLASTSLTKCQKLMKMHNIRRLPVVDDDNRVIGIISD
ncbi:MAG: CBS domain-containing protein, partial [Desulfovibrionaceae bacterium]|nr:CBS domain-containing protein [Desulfovibrionaceae bacterium]